MKTVSEHTQHIKGKPHHVRKRVAFGAATGATAFIALVWLVGNLSLGSFAIPQTSFADAARQGDSQVVVAHTSDSVGATRGVAGVAAALENVSAPAHIEIVDTASSTPAAKRAEQTTIPF